MSILLGLGKRIREIEERVKESEEKIEEILHTLDRSKRELREEQELINRYLAKIEIESEDSNLDEYLHNLLNKDND